tara:strand:- start:47230 stop:47436 length:207 start_codon:yes stop_codon:yes gene_type:complete
MKPPTQKATSIRNEDQSFKPNAMDVHQKTFEFAKTIMEDHPNFHSDEISFIMTSAIHTAGTFKTAELI